MARRPLGEAARAGPSSQPGPASLPRPPRSFAWSPPEVAAADRGRGSEQERMAERKRTWNKEDDLPVYLARPGTTAQTPRQKYGGMFAAVEGAYENKTIDFDAYSVGKKGSRTPRSGSRHDMLDGAGGDNYSETASDVSEISGSVISSPGERDDKTPGVEIRYPFEKELLLQGPDNGKVRRSTGRGGRGRHEGGGLRAPRARGGEWGFPPLPPASPSPSLLQCHCGVLAGKTGEGACRRPGSCGTPALQNR